MLKMSIQSKLIQQTSLKNTWKSVFAVAFCRNVLITVDIITTFDLWCVFFHSSHEYNVSVLCVSAYSLSPLPASHCLFCLFFLSFSLPVNATVSRLKVMGYIVWLYVSWAQSCVLTLTVWLKTGWMMKRHDTPTVTQSDEPGYPRQDSMLDFIDCTATYSPNY